MVRKDLGEKMGVDSFEGGEEEKPPPYLTETPRWQVGGCPVTSRKSRETKGTGAEKESV